MRDIDKLRACYDELHALLGDNAEPWESVKLVEEYRRYWRPKNVRVILLAQSHVHTTDEERKFEVSCKGVPNYPHDYPRNYARTIYCLAHGDNYLINCSKVPTTNDVGMQQYWQLLYSCENYVKVTSDFASLFIGKTPNPNKRIPNKINLLNSLHKRGIWLMNGSIMALSINRKKLPFAIIKKALQTSWDNYTGQVVKEANPAHIIVIGTRIGKALQERLPDNHTVIPAPGSHLPKKQFFYNWRKYYKLCQKYAPKK